VFRTPDTHFAVSSTIGRREFEYRYKSGELIAGRYLVDREVGAGGMCTVYLVGDNVKEEMKIALKLVSGETNRVRIETFRNEFHILTQLAHENLIRVFDFGVLPAGQGFYYTAEYIDGKDLRETAAGVTEDVLAGHIVQVCRALAYVHSRGYIHFDIKPTNILVTGDGVVKLADFGLSALAGRGLGRHIRGTPAYTSPEIIAGADADSRADLYSLGITLYEIVTGTVPFRCTELSDLFARHKTEAPKPPRAIRPEIPEYIERIILRLLAKNPADRYANANAVIEQLSKGLGTEIELQPESSVEGYIRTPPLIGRDKEMQVLRNALSGLSEGCAAYINIEGPGGIGRSRLIREMHFAAQILGHASVIGSGQDHNLFENLAKGFAPFARAQSQEEQSDKTRPEAETFESGALEKEGLPEALAGIIGLSEQIPLIICIDDLQDADGPARKAIARLSKLLETASAPPILLITARRDTEKTDGKKSAGVTQLRLSPLNESEIGAVASQMFGRAEAPEIFVSRLADATGGIPRALVETIRMLVASGSISVIEGRWHFRGGAEPFQVPSSLEDFYTSHVDELHGLNHGLALNLALLDRPVSMTEISAIHNETPKRIAGALQELERLGIVERTEGRISITNTGIRTSLCNSRSARTLQRHHEILAGKLENLRDRGISRLELARHFLKGGRKRKGIKHGLAAIESAEVENDPAAAASVLEDMYHASMNSGKATRAEILFSLITALGTEETPETTVKYIEQYRNTAPKNEEPARRALMERFAAECYGRLGRSEDAENSWRLALQLSKSGSREYIRTLLSYELILEAKGRLEECEKLLFEAAELVGDLKDYIVVELWGTLVLIALRKGREEDAFPRIERALRVAKEIGAEESAHLANLVGVHSDISKKPEEAATHFRRARELAIRDGDMKKLARIDTNLTRMCFQLRKTDEGVKFALEAESIFRRYADFQHLTFVYFILAQEARQRIGCGIAIEYLEKGVDCARASANVIMESSLLSLLSDVSRQRGDYTAAIQYADDVEAHKKRHNIPFATGTKTVRAATYAQIARIPAAFEIARQVLREAVERKDNAKHVIAQYTICQTAFMAGDFIAGFEQLNSLIQDVEKRSPGMMHGIKMLAADYFIALGQYEKVEEVVRELRSKFDTTGNTLDRAALEMLEGRIMLLRNHFDEAESMFRTAGHFLNPDLSIHVFIQLLEAEIELELRSHDAEEAEKKLERLREALNAMPGKSSYLQLSSLLLGARLALLKGDRAAAYERAMTGVHEARAGAYRLMQLQLLKIAAETSEEPDEVAELNKEISSMAEEFSNAFDEPERERIYRHFLEPAPESIPVETGKNVSKIGNGNARILLQLAIFLAQKDEPQLAIEAVLDTALRIFNAKRAFLVVKEGDEIRFASARSSSGEALKSPENEISNSIIDRIIRTGSPLTSESARDDVILASSESVSDLNLLSVLAVPVKIGRSIRGCLYMDNPETAAAFSGEDRTYAEYLASLTGSILEKQTALQNLKTTSESLQIQLDTQSAEFDLMRHELEEEKTARKNEASLDKILGQSDAIRKLVAELPRIAKSDLPVLITGESGTGKDLVSAVLHGIGPRNASGFVTLNCGGIPEALFNAELFGVRRGAFTGAEEDKPGLLETANGGTLFLDEIADLPLSAQNALAGAIADGTFRRVGGREPINVDIRIISATNRNLSNLIEKDLFRKDFLYRLNAVEIELPPLRDRKDDIPVLAAFFLGEIAEKSTGKPKPLTMAALKKLENYPWPGNVRELRNVLERAYIVAKNKIQPAHLALAKIDKLKISTGIKTLEEIEREYIIKTFESLGGKVRQTARALGIGRETLRRKLLKFGKEGYLSRE
jgi:DNA-binding NtrC family response regulator/tetratricopeptide (TPR) repeat protein